MEKLNYLLVQIQGSKVKVSLNKYSVISKDKFTIKYSDSRRALTPSIQSKDLDKVLTRSGLYEFYTFDLTKLKNGFEEILNILEIYISGMRKTVEDLERSFEENKKTLEDSKWDDFVS